jgi:tRNA modification GTPase
MYDVNDTIVAVSSPASDKAVIIRIAGPGAIEESIKRFSPTPVMRAGLYRGSLAIDDELQIDADLYLFFAPRSYTGQDLAEIHMHANSSVTEAVIARFIEDGLRMAEPGEFTARAFLNGKMDLAQAEAVNEVIVSSNRLQLTAAEKLLGGELTEAVSQVRDRIVECLSLIEAGLDFSGEDIEFISAEEAAERLEDIKSTLEGLLERDISDEAMIDLASVGIAGAPNAGKSSLLNKLLARRRSIISGTEKTTRDVLSGKLGLKNTRCILFDCAGLITEPVDILDELSQAAAIEALSNSRLVIFCVDISKDNWRQDIAIRRLFEADEMIAVATKTDLVEAQKTEERLRQLKELFGMDFLPISAQAGVNIETLLQKIDERLIALVTASGDRAAGVAEAGSHIALTARHRRSLLDAIENLIQSIDEVRAGNDEIATMTLRAAHSSICSIEQEHIDEEILENIFGRFCIGK